MNFVDTVEPVLSFHLLKTTDSWSLGKRWYTLQEAFSTGPTWQPNLHERVPIVTYPLSDRTIFTSPHNGHLGQVWLYLQWTDRVCQIHSTHSYFQLAFTHTHGHHLNFAVCVIHTSTDNADDNLMCGSRSSLCALKLARFLLSKHEYHAPCQLLSPGFYYGVDFKQTCKNGWYFPCARCLLNIDKEGRLLYTVTANVFHAWKVGRGVQ